MKLIRTSPNEFRDEETKTTYEIAFRKNISIEDARQQIKRYLQQRCEMYLKHDVYGKHLTIAEGAAER